jgi:hypothetical protein
MTLRVFALRWHRHLSSRMTFPRKWRAFFSMGVAINHVQNLPQSAVRGGIFVEPNPRSNQAPLGVAYSVDISGDFAPDGACRFVREDSTDMPALTGF